MSILIERETPRVPNHQLLRVVGRGAYGEIWLARSLTGALRAVKIVDERTFASAKAFQREFEGMARFEPISRSDAGFVDILHVGREEGGHFFYYVMELADDVTGQEVALEEYVPRTLRSELRRRSRLLVPECLAIALSLTRALGVLHRHGLVHRDIKPANIIFVGGVPKIADIGLVAASGQVSFVGTEGYVPPEGPGSVQADLFSLGKVLYEMAMGRDRLDFPALDSNFTRLPEKRQLLQINALLLRACTPDPRERYRSAEEMHADLERLSAGRAPAKHRRRLWPLAVLGLVLTAAGGGWMRQHRPGSIELRSEPPGAMVLLEGENGAMHRSPARFEQLAAGRHRLRFLLPGYEARELSVEVAPGGDGHPPAVQLTRSHGPLTLSSTPPGADYVLRRGGEVIGRGVCPAALPSLPTGEYEVEFRHAGITRKQQIEVTRTEPAVASAEFLFGRVRLESEPAGAEILVDGAPAGDAPLEISLAQGRHTIEAHYRAWPSQKREVEVGAASPSDVAFAFARGRAKITSAPTGAAVWTGGRELGRTPLLLEDLEPGPLACELRYAGYKPIRLEGEIQPGEQTFLGGHLTQHAGPVAGHPWENALGMKFAPVGRLLMGIWPVRVKDFEAFCTATGRTRTLPDFPQDPAHPVVGINLEDATAFCEWLTQHEARGGALEPGQLYRLPSDTEWSEAAGLPPEAGETPEQRDGKLPDFPWGRQWPPPAGAGNFADGSPKKGSPRIAGYRDGFAQTSPVGSFAPNKLGLCDMSGNVWQWVRDSYKGGGAGRDWGVLRGGSWGTSAPAELRSAYRNVVDRGERDVIFGFRVVLVPEREP